jgi:hypothetical protein
MVWPYALYPQDLPPFQKAKEFERAPQWLGINLYEPFE